MDVNVSLMWYRCAPARLVSLFKGCFRRKLAAVICSYLEDRHGKKLELKHHHASHCHCPTRHSSLHLRAAVAHLASLQIPGGHVCWVPACQAPNVGFAYVIAGIVGQNQATGLKDQSDLPGWEILRRGVCPYSTAQRMEIAYNQTWIITSTFLSGLIESFLPIFKQRWSMLQFGDFVQGFIQTC